MRKHFLVTVSEDIKALHGVRFAASFIRNPDEIDFTLFYVAPGTPADSKDHLDRKTYSKLTDSIRERGQNALDEARKLLVQRGFSSSCIHDKQVSKQLGTAREIVREARKGLYDAVVLGKRAYTLFDQVIPNSTSKDLLNQGIDFPVWISRRYEDGLKGVLLCVDDTEPSLRMADHVGFILGTEQEHPVTILHVEDQESSEGKAIVEKAAEKLRENGVDSHRIHIRTARGQKVVSFILEEARQGAYAAIAVGRGGNKEAGFFSKWLMGSCSMRLLEDLDRAALWVTK
jgi:nucleotide-binding universal stress UspA family protein